MSDLFDYLAWRGDIPMSQAPFNPVDGLILSILSYVHFDNLVPPDLRGPISLGKAAETYLALPEGRRGRVRCPLDRKLLAALARCRRFSPLGLAFAQDRFVPEEEMQFAAIAVLLEDGSAFLSFRGTDATLVGWKEDFSMSFLDAVPAQQAALDYVERFASLFPGSLRLGGPSKGGNLAVFAGALARIKVRDRILAIYNNDGPGFTRLVLDSPGYQELLTRLHTFIPQSSVVGLLLEHDEPHTVVRSRQIGLLQHDPYSWEVEGGSFLQAEEITPGSRMADQAIKGWLAGLSPQERSQFVDSLFQLLSAGEASTTADLPQPRSLQAALRSLADDRDGTRRTLVEGLIQLARSAASVWRENVP